MKSKRKSAQGRGLRNSEGITMAEIANELFFIKNVSHANMCHYSQWKGQGISRRILRNECFFKVCVCGENKVFFPARAWLTGSAPDTQMKDFPVSEKPWLAPCSQKFPRKVLYRLKQLEKLEKCSTGLNIRFQTDSAFASYRKSGVRYDHNSFFML